LSRFFEATSFVTHLRLRRRAASGTRRLVSLEKENDHVCDP
jgi:hypothetical protein